MCIHHLPLEQNGGDSSSEISWKTNQFSQNISSIFYYERLIGGKSSPVGLDNDGMAITERRIGAKPLLQPMMMHALFIICTLLRSGPVEF